MHTSDSNSIGSASDCCLPVHQKMLLTLGLLPDHFPPACVILLLSALVFAGGYLYANNSTRRKSLARELEDARAKLHYLQEKLMREEEVPTNKEKKKRKEIRIFIDGAFDMLHFGHMNAFRLARSLGTKLIVGVNSDDSITQCKGSPLMSEEDRIVMVSACKFVDEVVPNCPYIMNEEYLDWVIKTYNIDYVVHGSDPCIVDGKDVYKAAKKTGKYRSIPRTEGVSTTDIVGRMLLLTKQHHYQNVDDEAADSFKQESASRQSKFLTTSRMLQLFSAGVHAPRADQKVIYVDGAWDLFHPGHVSFLKEAKKRGDYLLVGIHGDNVVNRQRGGNLPLMNLHERVLAVLGCRYVSDVVIDAPYNITHEMIQSLNISEVVRGSCSDDLTLAKDDAMRYEVPIRLNMFTTITISNSFSILNIIRRIQKNHESFQKRFEYKQEAENQFYRSQSSSH